MAATDRKKASHLAGLISELERAPYNFAFFQAMRLIECRNPDLPKLGTSRRPTDDPIRLGQDPSMTFEPASLSTCEPGSDGRPPRLQVRFLGLLGPNGPLPLHLTEYALDRLYKHRDATFARFLDIFHHRMLTLFYRAWANNEPTVSFDRQEADRFAEYVGTPAGFGLSTLRNRDDIPDSTKFYYCGRLACQAKCPEGLEALLGEYFGVPTGVDEFSGEWIPIPDRDLSRLGTSPSNGMLGDSLILGFETWSCQHKFRVLLGPLGFEDYRSFLPGGNRIGHVVALVRNYSGDELEWDLRLILKWQEVPPFRLDGRCNLGWTTWLGDRQVKKDADDLVLNTSSLFNRKVGRNL